MTGQVSGDISTKILTSFQPFYREEWECVQQLDTEKEGSSTSPAQKVWLSQLSSATQKLIKQLGVSGEHRLYSGEVLDLSGDVSLILMFPPSDSLISHPNQEDVLLSKPDVLALPIHTFEMVHMSTYQSQLLGRYARLSCILEMDKLVSEHAKREAFSQTEINNAKQKLTQVQSFQEQLDEAWKQLRWVKDAISFARDKTNTGVSVATIVTSASFTSSRSHHSSFSSQRTSDNSPPSSPPFQFHHSSSDSIHLGTDQNRYSKSEERTYPSHIRGMKKSSTAENVRVTPKAEVSFVKSKTSECLYHRNSYDSNMTPLSDLIDTCICPKSTIPSSWLFSKSNLKLYRKDQPVARSECHLQDAIAPEGPLPRKTSAPPYLDTRNINQTQNSSLDSTQSMQDAISLESISDISLLRRRKESITETKENALKIGVVSQRSPSLSCYDLQYSFSPSINLEMQRAASSLSHESEASLSSMTASLKSLSSTETENDTLSLLSRDSGRSENSEARNSAGEDGSRRTEEKAIVQIFTAYESGLSSGASVKLQVTNKTTARDVIDMVVKELNRTVISKNKKGPTYGNDKLKNFCLVAVIDKRERCLRDDFKLLSIQDPWRRGKFYVRFKNDLLAAIEQCTSRQTTHRRSSSTQQSSFLSSTTANLPSQSSSAVPRQTTNHLPVNFTLQPPPTKET